MASLDDIITGLQIFAAHGGGDRYAVSAEHDEIRAGQVDGDALTEEEIARLDAAGWFHAGDCDCPDAVTDEDGESTGHAPTCNDWQVFV